jgi:hypothetical protein
VLRRQPENASFLMHCNRDPAANVTSFSANQSRAANSFQESLRPDSPDALLESVVSNLPNIPGIVILHGALKQCTIVPSRTKRGSNGP